MRSMNLFFFFKQKTAYEMRISDWSSDVCSSDLLAAVAGAGPAAILVPKVDSPEDVARYDAAIAHAPAATRLWTMIETPLAVLSIAAIAAASEMTRLAAFVLGFNDLAEEMRAPLTPGRTPYLPVLTQTVLAARAHGLRSEEHTSDLQSLMRTSYAVFCLT